MSLVHTGNALERILFSVSVYNNLPSNNLFLWPKKKSNDRHDSVSRHSRSVTSSNTFSNQTCSMTKIINPTYKIILPQNFGYCQETFISVGFNQWSTDFSKLELDLMVYSATSWAKDDDLSSNNVVGESYSSISPAPMPNQIRKMAHQGTKNYHSLMENNSLI